MEQTTQTPTLTEFLLARIAEDERAALEAQGYEQSDRDGPRLIHACDYLGPELADHIARWSPERVLADCQAKRRIVEEYVDALKWDNTIAGDHGIHGQRMGIEFAVRALALPYADHEQFQEEWKP